MASKDALGRKYKYTVLRKERMMKINIFSRWNATCGISMHAEMVGHEWLKQGHELEVFAPKIDNIWANDRNSHFLINKTEESYVKRCYCEPYKLRDDGFIDKGLLYGDCDVLVVQGLRILPIVPMLDFWKSIDAVKIHVFHESHLLDYKPFYDMSFDRIICFDDRYFEMLQLRFPKDTLKIIPYPCHQEPLGDKAVARRILGLNKDSLVFFSFGWQDPQLFNDYLWLCEQLVNSYNVRYIVFRPNDDWKREIPNYMNLNINVLTTEEIYRFLNAADAFLLPKPTADDIVVSSTLYQCLSAQCPVIAPDVAYFANHGNEVVKYFNREDLLEKIQKIITDEQYKNKVTQAAYNYVSKNSATSIAKSYINLFQSLLQKQRQSTEQYYIMYHNP